MRSRAGCYWTNQNPGIFGGPTGPCLGSGRQANPHIHRSSSFSSSDEVRVGVCKLSVAAQPALLKFLNRVPENLGAKIVYSI